MLDLEVLALVTNCCFAFFRCVLMSASNDAINPLMRRSGSAQMLRR